jgi:hypothetical protein
VKLLFHHFLPPPFTSSSFSFLTICATLCDD